MLEFFQRPSLRNHPVKASVDVHMTTVTLTDAKAHLDELIAGLTPGEQVLIVTESEPVATLTRNPLREWPCKAGSAKNTTHWMAPDFNAPLEDFREYME